MAKPALYFALDRAGWGRSFSVLCVTSERGRQVYGRRLDDSVTHVSERDVIYRFPEGTTAEFAKGATERADAERSRHETGIRLAREEVTRLESLRDAAVLAAAKGRGVASDRPGRCVVKDIPSLGCSCTYATREGCDNWREEKTVSLGPCGICGGPIVEDPVSGTSCPCLKSSAFSPANPEGEA